ncbi:phosphohydrolase [Rhodococcus sp. HNM0569]|uniref:phosphohydrolase n=1 Tax=Rhodococcus sp. HNM0569 TaxID=2716340 RepID=UPI00146E7346|nr:phosphohydrolase [Rhodococcus sp. HNM0569]NLU82386.1 phosphohydrolase [Rhodococcus sp. HNM0569]
MKVGELSRAQRLSVAGSAAALQIVGLPGLIRRGGGRPSSDTPLTPAPRSRLARAALEEARGVLAPAILAHSLRCWQWAAAFADIDSRCPDAESLYVACLLHDVALGAEAHPRVGCFAALGAAHAGQFLRGLDEGARIGVVGEAISRHMDPRTPTASDEAALLHDAAHLDVAGTRFGDVPAGVVEATLARYPRRGFAAEFAERMRHERSVRPRSSAAVLWRAGMIVPLRVNPLDRFPNPRDTRRRVVR